MFDNILDILFIYIQSFLKGRMPYRRKGTYIISDSWVVHYDVVSTKYYDVNYLIKDASDIFTLDYSNSTNLSNLGMRVLTNEYNKILSYITLQSLYKKNDIFFKNFKLQPYSEYITQRRDLTINKLLKS